jgi:cingulin
LRLRERELTALKGALKEEVASRDQEVEHVRQQYQRDTEQLRRSMQDVTQARNKSRGCERKGLLRNGSALGSYIFGLFL